MIVDAFKRMQRGKQIRRGLTMTGIARKLESICEAFANARFAEDRQRALENWNKLKKEIV